MIVGLTGGMGSGKSAVAQLFAVLGFPVYDTDQRARDMYLDAQIKSQIIGLLGGDAYTASGSLNRSFVAEKIFNDKEMIAKINGIIHPAVGRDFNEFVKANRSGKPVIKESALLFEAGLADSMDRIVLVTAPEEIRIKRVQKRDNLSEGQIRARLSNQWPDAKKTPKSDFVIVNDGRAPLIPQVLEISKKLAGA